LMPLRGVVRSSMFMAGIMMPRLSVSIRGSKLAMMVLEAATDFP
jgi:hypothetical protein